MHRIDLNFAMEQIRQVPDREKKIGRTFVEMLKDEINSVDEKEIYDSVKKMIDKYGNDDETLAVIDEVIEAVTGGATMTEILLVARDEVVEPTPVNVIDMDTLVKYNSKLDESDNQKH